MQSCRPTPGLNSAALNIAAPLSSSDSTTDPADQVLLGFAVVAENAEYDACHTSAADAATPATPATAPTTRADRTRTTQPAIPCPPCHAPARPTRTINFHGNSSAHPPQT